MKCASSAEADVSDQTVALFIAVIPQIARRCNLPVWLLLRAATIAFSTKHFGSVLTVFSCSRSIIRACQPMYYSGKDTN